MVRKTYFVIIPIIIIIINCGISKCKQNHSQQQTRCMLIDVAISGERNVRKKAAEKILKYKDLTYGMSK